MLHLIGIGIAVFVGIVLLSWFQAARPDEPKIRADEDRRYVTLTDLLHMWLDRRKRRKAARKP
jgi:hypothetical protein